MRKDAWKYDPQISDIPVQPWEDDREMQDIDIGGLFGIEVIEEQIGPMSSWPEPIVKAVVKPGELKYRERFTVSLFFYGNGASPDTILGWFEYNKKVTTRANWAKLVYLVTKEYPRRGRWAYWNLRARQWLTLDYGRH